MLVIGITGGIGSGKSAVTDRFAEHGIKIVDADVAARVVVEPGSPALQAISERHGESIILSDGNLNRAKLREIVFQDANERIWLEKLTHPLIRDVIIKELNSCESPFVILVSPLLIESGQFRLVNRVLVIDVPEAMQIERSVARDKNSEQQIRSIMAAQLPRIERLKHADDVIVNDKSLETLKHSVDELHQHYIQIAKDLEK